MFRFLSFGFFFLLPHLSSTWDVSIAVTNGIHLAKETNGSLVPTNKMYLSGPYHETTRPLVHDPKNNYLYVSGTILPNATVIYRVHLDKGYSENLTIIDPVVPATMKGKILGIEHDYSSNVLFWSNGQGGKILKAELNDTDLKQVVLYNRNTPNLITGGLALDECSRTLFWTSYIVRDGIGFIESIQLDGSNHLTLHHNNLHNPTDITIDQETRKLYWCDLKAGSSSTIERSNLDGSSREQLFAAHGVQPISMALTKRFVYWINVESDKFERIEKGIKVKTQDKILEYEAEKLRSIVAHKNIQTCANGDTMVDVKSFPFDSPRHPEVKSSNEEYVEKNVYEIQETTRSCLNGGYPDSLRNTNPQVIKCKCRPNFYGQFCEKCEYCLNGKCSARSNGTIKCDCDRGFNGSRCENNVCFNYCLNGGICSVGTQAEPSCNCRTTTGNYQGSRCEIDCDLFCQNNPTSGIYDSGKPICSCGRNGLYVANMENATAGELSNEKNTNLEMHLRFGLIVVCCVCILFLIAIACLVNSVVKLRKRPRIKKRIIVNKNVTPTPLTSRPSPGSEQCEITIENCCNMNICETPCYEPQLRASDKSLSKTEEKKNLLRNMEGGESGSTSQDTLY